MRQILTSSARNYGNKHFFFLYVLLIGPILSSCEKADKFYEKLEALPQINNRVGYAYKPSYVVGETLDIIGKLGPQATDFTVNIGGITAQILKAKIGVAAGVDRHDSVSVLITEEMLGKGREVKITSGGYSTLGASIDVYKEYGEGSIDAILSNRLVASFNNNANVFLHCINGKGNVYYYALASQKLYHITKDGTRAELFDFNGTSSSGIQLSEFLAGGVTPDGKKAYISVKTSDNDYVFASIDLTSAKLTLINRSAAIEPPFQGNATDVNTVATRIYPDNNGNVYLGIGFHVGRDGSYAPGAIALYRSADNTLRYLFKEYSFSQQFKGLPGKQIDFSYLLGFRFNPKEGLVYLINENYQSANSTVIDVYDLLAVQKTSTLKTNDGSNSPYNVLTSFSAVNFPLWNNRPAISYGYLPMPGSRLLVLMYQQTLTGGVSAANALGFPRWIVLNFEEERTYLYAQDRFRLGNYSFQQQGQWTDELLNYDEDGNLYSTANNRALLISTRPL